MIMHTINNIAYHWLLHEHHYQRGGGSTWFDSNAPAWLKSNDHIWFDSAWAETGLDLNLSHSNLNLSQSNLIWVSRLDSSSIWVDSAPAKIRHDLILSLTQIDLGQNQIWPSAASRTWLDFDSVSNPLESESKLSLRCFDLHRSDLNLAQI